jgi:amino acid permease
MSTDDHFFSRDELLGGLPTRQASTLLFAIESRIAHLKQQSRIATARFRVEKSAEEEEDSFFKAFSEGREAKSDVSIQDLERYASGWTSLVPEDNIGIRAALAHLLGEKYIFTHQSIPLIRDILAFDTIAVKEAYQTHYKQPLESIYVEQISRREQLKWLWSRFAKRLENLPPFWIAFSLTITETVGATILALPIAIAKVGVVGGLVILIILGLANLLTSAALVESITRNGNMRYGNTYFGRLVKDYLGSNGVVIFSIALLLYIALVLIAYYIGISSTLEEATGISSTIWVVVIFSVGLYFLQGKSLNSTIASAMLISFLNISIILLLVMLALPHVNITYLQYSNIPFFNGQPFDPSILDLVFGVILTAYFGHISAGNAAKVVLRQDPGGRSLLLGNVFAVAAVIVLYCLWVFAVSGSIAPDILANTQSTALSPLAIIIGQPALILGSIFVILGMGMGTIHLSLALFNQFSEWLPSSLPTSKQTDETSLVKRILMNKKSQFWISILPIVLIVLLVEWLIVSNQESFTGLLSIVGVVTVPLIGGIFPILMLVSSRRKGEYVPSFVFKRLGHPIVSWGIYLLFFVSILLHGLIIWEDPVLRIIALFASATILGMTYIVAKRDAFTEYAIIELRVDQNADGQAFFNATAVGEPLVLDLELDYGDEQQLAQTATTEVARFTKLKKLTTKLPQIPIQNLKLWVHQITLEDNSVSVPSWVDIHSDGKTQHYDLNELDGQATVQLHNSTLYQITIRLTDSE